VGPGSREENASGKNDELDLPIYDAPSSFSGN
jgi:hypothetical protein